jgi:hypothetical protein
MLERLAGGADTDHFYVVVVQQFDDALTLDVVVFDDQQALSMRLHIRLDPVERVLEVLCRCRFHEVGKRSVRQSVLPLFFDRQHLDGNVPGRRIELQVVQHRPPEHVRQEDVEGDGGWQVLLGERNA